MRLGECAKSGFNLKIVDTYGVEQDEALVEDLEGGGELLVVLLELANDLVGLLLGQLDQQALVRLHVERGDVQVRLVRRDFDQVVALA